MDIDPDGLNDSAMLIVKDLTSSAIQQSRDRLASTARYIYNNIEFPAGTSKKEIVRRKEIIKRMIGFIYGKQGMQKLLQEAPAKTAVKPQVLINKGKAIERAGISARKAAWESAESRLTPLARFERNVYHGIVGQSFIFLQTMNFDELRWYSHPSGSMRRAKPPPSSKRGQQRKVPG